MTDFALSWDASLPGVDLDISGVDYVSDEGLGTAVVLSLFTDRRAEVGDILPDGETNRRGYWADTDDDKFGSRLWLLARSKGEPDLLARVEEYAREALQWMLDDKIASDIIAVAETIEDNKGYGLLITIVRPQTDPVTFRYGRVWAAQAESLGVIL